MEMQHKSYWEAFIELYRENSCLWDMKSKDYTNKGKRKVSYEILLKKLQEMNPQATLEILKKKINNMRTTFRRELKKVQDSMRRADEIYEPTLWYYDLLFFISQSETVNTGMSDSNGSDNEDVELVKHNVEEIYENEEKFSIPQEEVTFTPQATRSIARASTSSISVSQKNTIAKKRSLGGKKIAFLNLAHKTLPRPDDDEYSVVGKRFAFQLRGMEEQQRFIAEKLISDVMFYGRMGKLSEDATINLPNKVPNNAF